MNKLSVLIDFHYIYIYFFNSIPFFIFSLMLFTYKLINTFDVDNLSYLIKKKNNLKLRNSS